MSAGIHGLNRHINSYLKEYLSYDAPGYAVLINAKWGAGKTHFINKYREEKLPSPGDDYVYLSLNGLKSVQEIYDCLIAEMLPAIDRKSFDIAGRFLKTALSCFSIESQIGLGDFVNPCRKNNIYIFDDVERFNGSAEEVFGFFNILVEHEGIRVILLANEDEILDNWNSYRKIKEKVVGKTLRLSPDFSSAYVSFVDLVSVNKIKCVLDEKSEIVKNVYYCSELNNLRLLKQAIWEFSSFFQAIKEKYLNDSEALNTILSIYFSFFFEYHSGRVLAKDLRYRKDLFQNALEKRSENYEENNIDIMEKRYPWIQIREELLNNKILESVIVDGLIDSNEINSSIESSSYYVNIEQEPEWKTLWHWDERTEEQFFLALNRFNENLRNLMYKDEGVIIHAIGIKISLARAGLIPCTVDEAVSQLKDYIERFFHDVDKEKYFTDEVLSRYEGLFISSYYHESYDGLGFIERDTEEFKEVIAFFDKAFDKTLHDSLPLKAKSLLNLMGTDMSSFYMKLCLSNSVPTAYYNIPIFKYVDPCEFVEHFLNLHPAMQLKAALVFRSRFSSAPNSVKEDEGNWLRELKEVLSNEVKKLSNFDRKKIERIVKNFIEPYAQ